MKQDKEGYDVLDTGVYDESFVGNWMRRTDWAAMFSGVNPAVPATVNPHQPKLVDDP